MSDARARARGALWGLALGDALGMPTEALPPAEVAARAGVPVPWFAPAGPGHPVAAGLPAGTVTDDTGQALLLARLLVAGEGRLRAEDVAAALLAWEDEMRARGSLDLLGPSTRRACAAIRDGEPVETAGRFGATNGAAMRIAPVGIARPVQDREGLLALVVEASRATHHTSIGLAGAAAVAAAVSAGLDGAGVEEATAEAVRAAQSAARLGHWVAGADVGARVAWAAGLARGAGEAQARERILTLVGTSVATQESVPAAFAVLAALPGDPWRACRLAASLGGDSDTIAAIAGAIGGAVHGSQAFPDEARALVGAVNDLDLDPLADRLLALRAATASSPHQACFTPGGNDTA
jgi:ADP-ribosylglycohydrolase